MFIGQGTHKRIIELLQQEGELTAPALSSRLDRSVQAVRRHLRSGIRAGLVQSRTVRRHVGRPVLLFSLTEQGAAMLGRRYEKTALELLAQAEKLGGSELVTALLTGRQAALMQSCEQQAQGKTIDERVRLATEQLNKDGYSAESKSGYGQGIQLILHHCPVPALAQAHPEVCRLEYEAVCRILGRGASVTVCSNMSGGDTSCMYQIKPAEAQESEPPPAS